MCKAQVDFLVLVCREIVCYQPLKTSKLYETMLYYNALYDGIKLYTIT